MVAIYFYILYVQTLSNGTVTDRYTNFSTSLRDRSDQKFIKVKF